MKVGLFIPCYVNQFYPQVAISTLQVLQSLGCDVDYPERQTCCGQPMANSGFEHLTDGCNKNFIKCFDGYDYIVAPSGSCVLHIKHHLHSDDKARAERIRNRVYEFCEFLVDVLKVTSFPSSFPFKVGIHQSCHGQRGLMLSQMSELVAAPFSKLEQVLHMVNDIELISLSRKDECCGFGGTFCVVEESVSARMGQDRVKDHISNGAQVITGADMSCLMHMEGILKRQKSNVQVKHIAEILMHSHKNN